MDLMFDRQRFKKIFSFLKTLAMGGSPGLVVMGGDSCSEGRGFESRCRILDGHNIFSHIICCKNCNVCLKRQNKRKRGRGWPIFLKRLAKRK